MARSKLFAKSDDTKGQFIQIRVTQDQKALLKQKADDAGKSLSDYLIQVGLERPIRSKIAATIINDIRLLALDVKRLARDSGVHQDEHMQALHAIKTAMQKIWDKKVKL